MDEWEVRLYVNNALSSYKTIEIKYNEQTSTWFDKIKVLYQFLKIFVIDKLDFLNHVLKPILIG